VGLHSHFSLGPGQVVAQYGNSSLVTQGIEVYDNVKDTGIPYTYRITTGDKPALLPLDLGDITSAVLTARNDLATAMAGNFLKGNKYFSPIFYALENLRKGADFAEAASGNLVGIAYIRPLDRAAVEHAQIVKLKVCASQLAGSNPNLMSWQINAATASGIASAVSRQLEDVVTGIPTFVTRGVANSTAASEITMYVYQRPCFYGIH
jgi:hypothetical protein